MQIINSVQRQATDWKEIFTNHVLDMGIITNRHVGHLLREFNSKKKKRERRKTKERFFKKAFKIVPRAYLTFLQRMHGNSHQIHRKEKKSIIVNH